MPSLKYDALCLLNSMSGDPYYLRYYEAEYDHFHPLFTPEEQAAFQTLKHIFFLESVIKKLIILHALFANTIF